MAIQVGGTTRIDNSKNGIFVGCSPGGGSSLPSASDGKLFWNTSDKNMYICIGSTWRKIT